MFALTGVLMGKRGAKDKQDQGTKEDRVSFALSSLWSFMSLKSFLIAGAIRI